MSRSNSKKDKSVSKKLNFGLLNDDSDKSGNMSDAAGCSTVSRKRKSSGKNEYGGFPVEMDDMWDGIGVDFKKMLQAKHAKMDHLSKSTVDKCVKLFGDSTQNVEMAQRKVREQCKVQMSECLKKWEETMKHHAMQQQDNLKKFATLVQKNNQQLMLMTKQCMEDFHGIMEKCIEGNEELERARVAEMSSTTKDAITTEVKKLQQQLVQHFKMQGVERMRALMLTC